MQSRFEWHTFFIIGGGTLAAFAILGLNRGYDFSVGAWMVFAAFYLIRGLGITVGFHRYLTHGSFKCNRVVKVILLWAGIWALQGGPIKWVRDHRVHHKFEEQEDDPHSPRHGFWWAHWGWLFRADTSQHEYIVGDLRKDSLVSLHERWHWPIFLTSFLLPTILLYPFYGFSGAVEGLLLPGIVGIAAGWHFTFSVNSIGHKWGWKPSPREDDSRNFFPLVWFTMGEFLHANHHRDPKSAFLAWNWWQTLLLMDLPKFLLLFLEKMRLVWNLQRPNPALHKILPRSKAHLAV